MGQTRHLDHQFKYIISLLWRENKTKTRRAVIIQIPLSARQMTRALPRASLKNGARFQSRRGPRSRIHDETVNRQCRPMIKKKRRRRREWAAQGRKEGGKMGERLEGILAALWSGRLIRESRCCLHTYQDQPAPVPLLIRLSQCEER